MRKGYTPTTRSAGLLWTLCTLSLCSLAMCQQKEQSERSLFSALKKAVAGETDNAASEPAGARFPKVFQLRRAARTVTDELNDARGRHVSLRRSTS